MTTWTQESFSTFGSWKKAQDYKLLFEGYFFIKEGSLHDVLEDRVGGNCDEVVALEGGLPRALPVIVGTTTVDMTMIFPFKGVGEVNLRHKYGKIFCQKHIYEEDLQGNRQFEFELSYKYLTPMHTWTLFFLRNYYVLLRLKSWVCCCMYDEIKAMTHTLAPVQQFTQLKEETSLQGQIEELPKKI